MVSKKVILFFSFILLVVLFMNCSEDKTTLVARVGGRKITLKEFEKEFGRGKSTKAARMASFEEKKEHLDRIIAKELKIIDAYQHGLNEDEKLLNQVREREQGIMFRRLIDKEVSEKVLPESEIKDFYEKASKEVKIRQIVVKFDPNNETQKQNAFKRARKIVTRLKDEEQFTKLAEEESDDINTAKKGGDKGYLKWGPKSSEDPIYSKAFDLRLNEISDPIEKGNAYYIIKVVHIRKYPSAPYEQERERIRQRIFSMRRNDIEVAYYTYLDELRRKYKLAFIEPNLTFFVNKINQNAESGSERPKNTIDYFSQKEMQLPLAIFTNDNIDISDLAAEIDKMPSHRRPRLKSILEVQNFLNSRIVPLRLLEMEVKAKNIENDSRVKQQIKNYKENLMINTIQKIQVYDKIEINDDLVRQYYEENDSEFMHPERREVREIYVRDEQLAKEIVKKARAGTSFGYLFKKYNEKEMLEENEGKLGLITAGRGGIGKPSFAVEIGGVTDPIKLGNGYSIIKVLGKRDPEKKTFEESKRIAKAKFRRLKIDERESQWISEMKEKVDFVIYDNNLEKAMKNYIGSDILTVK